jgi:hypothetical protein
VPSRRPKPAKPKPRASAALGSKSAIIPQPFACSAIIHGERVYAAKDMRHDEAQTYADQIGAVARSGVWADDADIEKAIASPEAAVAFVKSLDKAATKLERVE